LKITENKKNVYMIQISAEYVGSVYLPYAIGSIAACAWENKTVKQNYCLKPFIFRRDDISVLVNSFENPYIVAFSGYLWNFEFNKEFARNLKEKYPGCIIIFGGHSTPGTTGFLDKNNYIDYLVLGEGEIPFTELLCAISNGSDLHEVSNIIYKNYDGKAVKSITRIITDIDYPSPFIKGYFDEIIINNPEIKFSAVLETNRGCPYRCSYCDWGIHNEKVRQFPLKKVYEEIAWICANKIEYLVCADANFGIFDRDCEIADKFIEARIKTGYPWKLNVNYAKNSNLRVFDISKKMNEYGLSKGATLSFQSFSPTVLKNIRRTNMTFEHFNELMALYNFQKIKTYSDLIIGLPGETYESFVTAIDKLLEAGQHVSIIIFNCYWLVNSEMGSPHYIKKHKIETVSAPLHRVHCPPSEENISEYSQIVVSNSTMDRNMWVRTKLFSICVECFHCLGLLRYLAIYLYYEHGIKYRDFYEQLINWLESTPGSLSGSIFAHVSTETANSVLGHGSWFYVHDVFGNITWPFEEGMFLELGYQSEQFYSEISDFLKSFNIEQKILFDLIKYQKGMLKLPQKSDSVFNFDYDFHNYFNSISAGSIQELKAIKNTIRLNDTNIPDKWEKYAIEVVWFGRHGGDTLYTDVKQTFT